MLGVLKVNNCTKCSPKKDLSEFCEQFRNAVTPTYAVQENVARILEEVICELKNSSFRWTLLYCKF